MINPAAKPNAALARHGLEVTADGKTPFASSQASVFAFPYDATAGTVGNKKAVITNKYGFPTTSTLRIPTSNLDALLAQRGSSDNIDSPATVIDSGRSQTGIFNIASILATPVDYYDAGDVLGWGLRAA
ncbi:uncharacterized protein RSE6_06297 [Rhynchosporium secalis]|uniref:Pyrroloquinoline quinone-dependent pyranose dehydrogenase beta-propeller domain-containing protein n=1 Tax=Rhynchosporium secalis TaxID=38038 RepID=A0A1E1MA36_RHYSE|nr:uncharacterized protein RSE6_06297 [Rhynchosporium secalis]